MVSEGSSNEELAKVLCNLQYQSHQHALVVSPEYEPPPATVQKNRPRTNSVSSTSSSSPPLEDVPAEVRISGASSAPVSPTDAAAGIAGSPGGDATAAVSSTGLAAASREPSYYSLFPNQLYELMGDSSFCGYEDVVSWQPSGINGIASSFKVYSKDRFVNEIMPRFFRHTKFKSFQRQLNIYGFRRIQDGPNRGGYYHPYFVRESPDLLNLIIRKRTSETATVVAASGAPSHVVARVHTSTVKESSRATINPPAPPVSSTSLRCLDTFLNAATLVSHSPAAPTPSAHASAAPHDQLMALLAAATDDENNRHQLTQQNLTVLNAAQLSPPLVAALSASAAAPPTNLEAAEVALTPTTTDNDVTNNSHGMDTNIAFSANQHIFPCKLYKVLDEGPNLKFSHIVSWGDAGKSFKVHNTREFVKVVMPQYFDQTKYESFRRQLSLYGFTRIARGPHRGVYSHPLFQRGHKDWCRFISRHQPSQLKNSGNNNHNNVLPPLPSNHESEREERNDSDDATNSVIII